MTDRQITLINVIERNPGIRFREIMRQTGMKNGVLSHYLYTMERAGRIRVMRGPRQTSYCTPGISDGQLKVAAALQRSTPRSILLSLAAEDGRRFSDVVDCCGKSPSTISAYLGELIRDGLVSVGKAEGTKRYYIKCASDVNALVEACEPGPSDRPVSGFEDIMNSL